MTKKNPYLNLNLPSDSRRSQDGDEIWMKKSITIVGTLPPVTGISPYNIGLVREFKNAKVTFEAIRSPYPEKLYPGTLYDDSSRVLLKALPKQTVINQDLVWWNPLSWLVVGLGIRSQEVYLNWWTIALFPMLFTVASIARLRRKLIIAIIHNPVGHERYPLDTFLTRLFFTLCHQLIVFTPEAKEWLINQSGLGRKQFVIKSHPPLDFYPKRNLPRKAAREKLNLPANVKIYLFFGRIRQYKNLKNILRWFAQATPDNPQALLVIAGEPWVSFNSCQDLIANLGIKKQLRLFLKYIPTEDVSLFFRAADVLLLAHQGQGGGSGVESLAESFNLPIVKLDKLD